MAILMAARIPTIYPEKFTHAGRYLAGILEENGKPVLTPFDFFQFIRRMYREAAGKKLYLRRGGPSEGNFVRLRANLRAAGVTGADRDYGGRIIRLLTVSDLPAEDIICLVDPTCYVSHLSAMQRWGLTDRSPSALILTRPDRKTARSRLQAHMTAVLGENESNPFPLKIVGHPTRVRRRPVHIYESKAVGAFLKNRGDDVRLSTIGQTFLDMLQRPDLCGGMSHILDVWNEHAGTYLEDIVAAVDTAPSKLVKSRGRIHP